MISIVLFEDHTYANFRPLTWGLPTYEIRCGMFNLRERVSFLNKENCNGGLLPRAFLEKFHQPKDWAVGPLAVEKQISKVDRVLFLNGRVGPEFSFIKDLMNNPNSAEKLSVWDNEGLLAAWVNCEDAGEVIQSLLKWQTREENIKALFQSNLQPQPWDGGPIANYKRASTPASLRWIWEIVPATPSALKDDLNFIKSTTLPGRDVFGIKPDPHLDLPIWTRASHFNELAAESLKVSVMGNQGVWVAEDVILCPGTVLDVSSGPIILDRGVKVMPNAYLEGPLFIGAGSIVKAGATIYGDSSFGVMCRIAGEIGESTFGDFSNKQHAGFIGHAVLGSWVNLGAMTTNSDLKNNYGNVKVDLGMGPKDTELRFVGLFMGDHGKTAIGTLFNTGTTIGFGTNIFGGGMPPKFVGNLCWGGNDGCPVYDPDRASATADVVMGRRGCVLQDYHRELFSKIALG